MAVDDVLSLYQIKYVVIPKIGTKRWVFNGSVNTFGTDETSALNNASPLLEQRCNALSERARHFDVNFIGYKVKIRSIQRLLFYLPITAAERIIPAFAYLGKGILDD